MGEGNCTAASRRIALLLEYDGTHFNGWQTQHEGRTVQGEVEQALAVLTRQPTAVVTAGRTDSGVHARGQVAHFTTQSDITLQKFCVRLNGILAKDVAVKNAFHVPDTFHARFDARQREYVYIINNHPQRSPFAAHRAVWHHEPLDVSYLKEIASYMVGTRDFASFCKTISSDINTVRTIHSVDIDRLGDEVRFVIRGNAFLHNMIRIMVGTMLSMHKSQVPPRHILDVLDGKDRRLSGITAPPHGLYLNRIVYDPPLESMPSAF